MRIEISTRLPGLQLLNRVGEWVDACFRTVSSGPFLDGRDVKEGGIHSSIPSTKC